MVINKYVHVAIDTGIIKSKSLRVQIDGPYNNVGYTRILRDDRLKWMPVVTVGVAR